MHAQVTIIDVLRRANAEVTVASVEDSLQVCACSATCMHFSPNLLPRTHRSHACGFAQVDMSRHVKLVADVGIADVKDQQFDAIALPVRAPALHTCLSTAKCNRALLPPAKSHLLAWGAQGGMPGAERLRDCEDLQQMQLAQKEEGRTWAAICASPAVVLESKGLLQGKAATCHPAFSDKLSNQSHVPSRVVVDGSLITSRGPGTALEFALALVAALFGAEKAQEVAGPMVMHPLEPAKLV
jgi:4-methyl-5(b-hydroxyethyl)-thiazole monophosphate biosynthesis